MSKKKEVIRIKSILKLVDKVVKQNNMPEINNKCKTHKYFTEKDIDDICMSIIKFDEHTEKRDDNSDDDLPDIKYETKDDIETGKKCVKMAEQLNVCKTI